MFFWQHFYWFLSVHSCDFQELEFALKIFNYFFTSVFIIEATLKILALGFMRYIKDR